MAADKHNQLMETRTKAQLESEIVKRLSDGFFMRKAINDVDPRYDLGTEAPPPNQVAAVSGPTLYQDPESGEMVEGNLMPPGSYLDVAV
jgi:hypothetical protein